MKILKWLDIGFIGVMFRGGNKATTSSPKGNASDFFIKVTGTDGAEFSGVYTTVIANGKFVPNSVYGTVPTEYPIDGDIKSVSFQKKGKSGTLKFEIYKGNKVVAESETEAAYGMVSAVSM